MKLLTTNFCLELELLVRSAVKEIVVSSPFVSLRGCRLLTQSATPDFRESGTLHFLTNLSPDNVVQGTTDPAALRSLTTDFVAARLYHLPRLHAKTYIIDRRTAIVTSANLTSGGLDRNVEYGVAIEDTVIVDRIHDDMLRFSSLGAAIDHPSLESYCSAAEELSEAFRKARSAMTRRLRKLIQSVNDALIRQRLSEGSMTKVFENTVLYLLETHGPLATTEMHPKILQIHPDLCDDSIDRVIDGKRYGKKWKHAVRSAQSHLKAQGKIVRVDGTWRLTTQT